MEIKFKRDTSFRKQFFVPDSFAHPAKMDAQLLIWVVENYTKTWETILDPMAGSGTTMLACGLSRNVILVELEQKFVRMVAHNWEAVRMKPQLGYGLGECINLWGDARDILKAQEHPYEGLWLEYPKLDYATIKAIRRHSKLPLKGDARQLEGLLVDKCIFSPPYAETLQADSDHGQARVKRLRSSGHDDIADRIEKAHNWHQHEADYNPNNKDNISNLPYGSIDKIVDLHNGQIDGIIESNGKILRGMRDTTNPERERNRAPFPLSEAEILQSGLSHSQSESPNEGGQTNLDKGTDKGNRRTVEGDRGEDKQIKNGQEISQNLNSQEGNTPKRGNQREDKELSSEGRESSPMERGVEEISRSKLADSTEESSEAGQLPVSNMPRGYRPSASSNPIPHKQGQQPDQPSQPMPTLSRQGNSTHPQPSPQDSPQTLQTPLVDAVISSPPYEGSLSRDRSKEDWWDEERETKHAGGSAKIAKGYQIDAVVTSPPYEDSLHRWEGISDKEVAKRLPQPYTDAKKDNIGNLKSVSYLEAMLQVYAQCWSVLKDGGLLILVTKNFIRNKQIVRLDTDTIKLCEQAGFDLIDSHLRKLPSQSFWRVIYHQKHPEVEQINYEDVLVFQKMELKV